MLSRRARLFCARRLERATRIRLKLELLEDRAVPAVLFFGDPNNPGKSIVQFTEDVPGTSDTLLLRPTNDGLLQYQLNGAAFTTDLNSSLPGVQSLSLTAISRIDVTLGGGSDVLDVDASSNSNLVPPPAGITFTADDGSDTLVFMQDANMTLTTTSLTTSTGGVVNFTNLEQAKLTGGNSNNSINASPTLASAFAGKTTLDGGAGDDTITGGSGDDVLVGTQGKDFLDGRGGNDQLFSGNSGTTCLGGDGNDTLFGGNGQDVMSGGAGNDSIFGGNGQDTLLGGDGNDSLNGGNGNDLVDGGAGTDRVVGSDNVSWTLTDSTLTGEGTDALVSIEEAQLTGGGGNNIIDASGFHGATTLVGGGGNDLLIGGFGSNLFIKPVGEFGNVTMVGGPAGSTNQYQIWPQGTTSLISKGGFDEVDFSIATSAITFDLNVTDGTPQVVTADGSTVSLTGLFDQLLGSSFDDVLIASSNSTLMGGAGSDSLVVVDKSNVTLVGQGDSDSLLQTGGTSIIMSGDSGIDSLTSTNGTGITMTGGSDADSLLQNGGTSITMSGDSGTDTLISSGGTSITMTGGSDADSLQQTGGTSIVMSGDSGTDTLLSSGGTNITMTGGSDADSLQQTGGTGIIMSGDDGADTLLSFNGSGITMSGGADADTLLQSGGTTIVMSGDSGSDSLISTNGAGITMNGGSDADSLLQNSGSSITMSGDDGADALYSTAGASITMTGGADADSLVSNGGTTITMSGDSGSDTLIASNATSITMNGGSDADLLNLTDDSPATDLSSDTLTGGSGDDTYVIVGNSPGSIAISESAADAGADTIDLSNFTGGPVTLDLALTSPQALGAIAGNSLALSEGMGIENVIGTGAGDTMRGNGANNQIQGADLPPPVMGAAPGWDGVTQVVFLDFDSRTDPGEHVYSQAERGAIQALIEADYAGPDPAHPWFHFQFTQSAPQLPDGQFIHVYFNDLQGTEAETGGFSDDLDFRNLNPGGNAYVQVNGILGATGQPADATENWIALSEKIAAHETGHLVGLLHQDAFGPIGYGIHFPPGANSYKPIYPGLVAAYETFDHLMSSPASVGSNRFNDLRNLFFGEREAIKLAFAESGTVVNETAGAHQTFQAAQLVPLVPLAAPNTLSFGLDSAKQLYVEAVDVTGNIAIDPGTGESQSDFYSFTGKKGDLMSFEVLSRALTRLGSDTIDAVIRIRDASGNVLAFNGGTAVNDDQFEPTDSSLFDFRLPADGTYIVEVDTFSSATTPHTDTGSYELFMYRFDSFNANDGGDVIEGRGGSDNLIGGLGNDTLTGGSGNDVLNGGAGNDVYAGLPSGNDTLLDSAGRDTLNFAAASQGITVNLALSAGQTQTLDAAGDKLALNGTLENVFGSALADSLTGNSANNILVGGDGNDTLAGGNGNDLLIGGLGADSLQGQAGDDLLIGGTTTFDSNQAALDAIEAEWSSGDSYAQRVAYLTGTPGGANGAVFLISGTTVLNDNNAKDTLLGGAGMDLFFKFGSDMLSDKENGETVL